MVAIMIFISLICMLHLGWILIWDNYYNTGDVLGSWFYFRPLCQILHDCPDDSCFTDIVQENIYSAIQYIITPSPVYPINYKNKGVIDVVVYSMPWFIHDYIWNCR